jgi:cytidyltransferase-like protein
MSEMPTRQKLVMCILSGGFDPIHSAHIDMIKDAAEKYDFVIVGVNSDEWLTRKKGMNFMSIKDRIAVVSQFKGVTGVHTFDDSDDTANQLILKIHEEYGNNYKIVFGNGGDRVAGKTIPEETLCKTLGIDIVDGLGGTTKGNSSSWILGRWSDFAREAQPVVRRWGKFFSLFKQDGVKVKKLVIDSGKSISLQLHHHRSEHWIVTSGAGLFSVDGHEQYLSEGKSVFVPACAQHKITNTGSIPLEIIEVQTGKILSEEDIIRFETIEGSL